MVAAHFFKVFQDAAIELVHLFHAQLAQDVHDRVNELGEVVQVFLAVGDKAEIEAKTQALLQAAQKLQAAAPQQEASGASNASGAKAADDVVDAEFEEVKDNK